MQHWASDVGLQWLVRVRWIAALLGLAMITAAYATNTLRTTPVIPLGLIAIMLGTNAWFSRHPGNTRAGGGLVWITVADTITLTGLLATTGGAANPFSVLYIVEIALAAVVLSSRWTWLMVGLSVGCFAALFFVGDPQSDMAHHAPGAMSAQGQFSLHLYGMLAAFTLAAIAVAYLVHRVSGALQQREQELASAREQAARSERTAALTTLAAGAAHELATPLGTIAVIAGELKRAAQKAPLADALRDDIDLIQAEVTRCRRILDDLSVQAEGGALDARNAVDARDLLDDVLGALPADRATRVTVHAPPDPTPVRVPRAIFIRILANLVNNAFDASGPDDSVELAARREGHTIEFYIRDQGHGMPEDLLARAADPFFTTKPAGQGLGLGLFLAQSVAQRLGGRLRLESADEHGTTAFVEVPARPDVPSTSKAPVLLEAPA